MDLLKLLQTSNQISKLLLDDQNDTLDHVLQLLGESAEVSRAYIFEIDHKKKVMDNTFEYVSPLELKSNSNINGIEAEKENLQNLSINIYSDWIKHLKKGNSLIINDLTNFNGLPQSKPILLEQKIKSLLVNPIYFENKLMGFVGFDECKFIRTWTPDIIAFLESNVDNIGKYLKANRAKTQLMETKIQLKNSEKQYRELFEEAPIGIFRTTSEGKVLNVNAEMARIVGAKNPTEAIKIFQNLGSSLYVNPSKRQEFIEILKKDGKVENFIFQAKNANGDLLWLNMSAKIRTHLPDGTFIIEGFDLDITKLKQSEQILQQRERLSAIGEFTSGIAHDFNNTLQGILGNVDLLLLEESLPEKCLNSLKIVKKLSNDAASRIKQLQRFSKKTAFTKGFKYIQINDIIDDSIHITHHLWQKKKNTIQIKKNIKLTQAIQIFGNLGELRSVFFNIIKNSVQAMPKGGKIIFTTKLLSDYVKISIKDTGIGMDKKTQSRIFQPFFTTKGFKKGIGLGLSTAYTIINEHNGEIYVKNSQPRKGTEIEILLPIISAKPQKSNDLKNQLITGAKILWVDDDPIIRDYANSVMKKIQHNIDLAENGQRALDLLQEHDYDVIITDISMPIMDGKTFLRKIKGKYPNTKRGILTGLGDKAFAAEKKDLQIDFILAKPIHIENLKKLIAQILNENRS